MSNKTKKFCNKCNKEYPLNHNYCPDCGERLNDNSANLKFPMTVKINNLNEFTDFFTKFIIVYEKIRPEFMKLIEKEQFESPKT